MKYYRVEPDAAGVPAHEGSELDVSVNPPRVLRATLELTSWDGDDFIECTPVYAVTPRLADALRASNLTGFTFRAITVRIAEGAEEWAPRLDPEFQMMETTGRPGRDDAWYDDATLVISERFVEVLRRFRIEHTDLRQRT